jgi:tryptophan halogenase
VHKKSWVKNVVGVGLANGFIEPLESTGLVLTHEAIHLIIDTLGQRDRYINQYDIDSFNFGMYDLTKGFKDFVSIHYALSTRNDTPYWKHVTENMSYSPKMNNWETSIQNEYQDLAEGLHTYNSFERLSGRGLLYVAAGFGYSPVSKRKMPFQLAVNQPNLEKTKDAWIEHRNNLLEKLENAPSQYEYLKKNIYNQ